MKIDELTIGQARELAAMFGQKSGSSVYSRLLGKNAFVRTVTHHYVGKCMEVHPDALVLTECSWVASDGRFHEAMATGNLDEVECYPPDAEVILNTGSFIDAVEWTHGLPKESK